MPALPLSERHVQILALAAQGYNSHEIGDQLELSPQTVRHHLMAARLRLHAHNTTHAIALALVNHIITLEVDHEKEYPVYRALQRGGPRRSGNGHGARA